MALFLMYLSQCIFWKSYYKICKMPPGASNLYFYFYLLIINIIFFILVTVYGLFYPFLGILIPLIIIYRGDVLKYLNYMKKQNPNGFGISIGGQVYFMFTDIKWAKQFSTSKNLSLIPLAQRFFGPIFGQDFANAESIGVLNDTG